MDQKTAKGQTPFMLAAQESYMGFMKLLIAHGARIDSEDEDGDTALHAVLKKYQLVSAIAGQLVGVESTPDITEVCKKYTYVSNHSRDSIRICLLHMVLACMHSLLFVLSLNFSLN